MDVREAALTLAAATGLAAVHLFAGRLRFLDVVPRSRWLSAAAGVDVAYVFVHVLPQLSAAQRALNEASQSATAGRGVYLVALVGLAVFFGLERLVRSSRRQRREAGEEDRASHGVFWVHLASFGAYNALVGYLLVRGALGKDVARPQESLLLFFIALALHFLGNDNELRHDYKEVYHRTGRWLLAAAVVAGWVIGQTVLVPEVVVSMLFAFLAGGIVLNALKEELPEQRESRLSAFVLGAAGCAALLVSI